MDGLGVTMETVQKEGVSEAVAVGAAVAAMIVAVLTAAVDMTVVVLTVVAEEDLLVWGKLHSATAPKVQLYIHICKVIHYYCYY